jgi:hypothetical protein
MERDRVEPFDDQGGADRQQADAVLARQSGTGRRRHGSHREWYALVAAGRELQFLVEQFVGDAAWPSTISLRLS